MAAAAISGAVQNGPRSSRVASCRSETLAVPAESSPVADTLPQEALFDAAPLRAIVDGMIHQIAVDEDVAGIPLSPVRGDRRAHRSRRGCICVARVASRSACANGSPSSASSTGAIVLASPQTMVKVKGSRMRFTITSAMIGLLPCHSRVSLAGPRTSEPQAQFDVCPCRPAWRPGRVGKLGGNGRRRKWEAPPREFDALRGAAEFLPFNLVEDLGNDLAPISPIVLVGVNADCLERGLAPLALLKVAGARRRRP